MYSSKSEVPVHPINLSNKLTSTLRTRIHFYLLVSTIFTVAHCKVYSFVKSFVHCSENKCFNCFFVVSKIVSTILNFPSVKEIPESFFLILFFDWRHIFCYMAVEAVADVRTVRYILHDAVFFAELLYLKTT